MSNWRDSLKTWVAPTPVQYKVADKECDFYPITVAYAFRLNRLARPLILALASFFGNKGDQGVESRESTQGSGDEAMVAVEQIVQPTDPRIAQLRMNQRTNALNQFMDAFEEPGARRLLAEIIMHSMREMNGQRFPSSPTEEDLDLFVEMVPLEHFGQMLMGVWEANKKLLGAQEGKALAFVKGALKGNLESASADAAESGAAPDQAPKSDDEG